ncbi:MAG: 23S rRNA (adenine(2503)-C(2))-methyltransferase RlmN [bacterium]
MIHLSEQEPGPAPKADLIGMNRDALSAFAERLGEKPFRGKQLFHWIYGRGVTDFVHMTSLASGLRQRLRETANISALELLLHQVSGRRDAEKFLFRLSDGLSIESVLMHERDRHTLCISSQVGCPVDCKFCATGKMGLLRNLSTGEIVNQVLSVRRLNGVPVTNVVVMGMGEPLLNYEPLLKACYLMSDAEGPNLAQRHIVISTSGLIPKIQRFTQEGHKFRLAISLNATTDEVRTRLMPLNRKYPIASLLAAAKEYASRSRQRVTFEYVLLAGVNDSREDAERLKILLRDVPCKLNLIPFNAVDENFQRPAYQHLEAFYQRLKDLHAPVTLRWSKGDDIDAACGQLWTKAEKLLPAVSAV